MSRRRRPRSRGVRHLCLAFSCDRDRCTRQTHAVASRSPRYATTAITRSTPRWWRSISATASASIRRRRRARDVDEGGEGSRSAGRRQSGAAGPATRAAHRVRARAQGDPGGRRPRRRISRRGRRAAVGRFRRCVGRGLDRCRRGVLSRRWACAGTGYRRAGCAVAVRRTHVHARDATVRVLDPRGVSPVGCAWAAPWRLTATTSNRRRWRSSRVSARYRDASADATGERPRLAGSGSTWFVEGAFPDAGRVATTIRSV